MTPEKAIEILNNYEHGFFGYKIDEVKEALNLAVKALKGMALPVAKITFDGKTAEEIKAEIINNFRSAGIVLQASEQEEQANGMPLCKAKDEAICEEMTADGHCNCLEPCPNKDERKQGEWIIVENERYGDNVKCPFCGKELAGTDLNFCCKCGANMRKGGKE